MFEDLQAQYGVDAVAGMENEVLAHPGHRGGEEHEHGQSDADDGQGIERVMDNDLVDDHLGEQGRGQRHQLNGERGNEHVAEHLAVLEQLGEEPAEAERLAPQPGRVGIGKGLLLGRGQQRHALVAGSELGERQNGMAGLALLKEGDPVFLHVHHEGKSRSECLCRLGFEVRNPGIDGCRGE